MSDGTPLEGGPQGDNQSTEKAPSATSTGSILQTPLSRRTFLQATSVALASGLFPRSEQVPTAPLVFGDVQVLVDSNGLPTRIIDAGAAVDEHPSNYNGARDITGINWEIAIQTELNPNDVADAVELAKRTGCPQLLYYREDKLQPKEFLEFENPKESNPSDGLSEKELKEHGITIEQPIGSTARLVIRQNAFQKGGIFYEIKDEMKDHPVRIVLLNSLDAMIGLGKSEYAKSLTEDQLTALTTEVYPEMPTYCYSQKALDILTKQFQTRVINLAAKLSRESREEDSRFNIVGKATQLQRACELLLSEQFVRDNRDEMLTLSKIMSGTPQTYGLTIPPDKNPMPTGETLVVVACGYKPTRPPQMGVFIDGDKKVTLIGNLNPCRDIANMYPTNSGIPPEILSWRATNGPYLLGIQSDNVGVSPLILIHEVLHYIQMINDPEPEIEGGFENERRTDIDVLQRLLLQWRGKLSEYGLVFSTDNGRVDVTEAPRNSSDT